VIKVFTHKITPRILYVFDYIFNQILETPYKLQTLDGPETPSTSLATQLFYVVDISLVRQYSGLKIQSKGYLETADINYSNLPNTCPLISGDDDIIEEDILGLLFYILSRAEEQLPNIGIDKHGRYLAENSILSKWRVIEKPIIDIWINAIAAYFGLSLPLKHHYKSIPTIDIDTGYKHLHKGLYRTFGGLVKLLFKDLPTFIERGIVLLRFRKDPYDIYSTPISELKKAYPHLKVFVLNAKRGAYDSGLPQGSKGIKILVKTLLQHQVDVGIHPSYQSNKNKVVLEAELKGLRNCSPKVHCSRQHFLKLHLPATYANLESLGIYHDYSMAYPNVVGFRAGTCRPYRFFNVSDNRVMNITVHSAAFMDGCFFQYNDYNTQQALALGLKIKRTVEEVGGEFISIWHESTVSESSDWSTVFKSIYPCR